MNDSLPTSVLEHSTLDGITSTIHRGYDLPLYTLHIFATALTDKANRGSFNSASEEIYQYLMSIGTLCGVGLVRRGTDSNPDNNLIVIAILGKAEDDDQ